MAPSWGIHGNGLLPEADQAVLRRVFGGAGRAAASAVLGMRRSESRAERRQLRFPRLRFGL
jgi:hypothetical protein